MSIPQKLRKTKEFDDKNDTCDHAPNRRDLVNLQSESALLLHLTVSLVPFRPQMTRQVAVLCAGFPADRPRPNQLAGCALSWTTTTPADASVAWSRLACSNSSDLIAWIDDTPNAGDSCESLREGIQALEQSPQTKAWFCPSRDPWSDLLFSSLPPAAAVLARGPLAVSTLVLRRSALLPADSAPLVPEVGWSEMARLAIRGDRLALAKLPPAHRASPPNDATFPLLTPPAWPREWREFRSWLSQHLAFFARNATPDRCDQAALQAGIWQCLGELDLSHTLSQQHEGQGRDQLCDYWHAIMHRREPDYGNARYWFRQLGRHPAWVTLAERVNRLWEQAEISNQAWRSRLLRGGAWDSFAMVDLAEAAVQDASLESVARRIQALELVTLMEYCLLPLNVRDRPQRQ